MKLRDPRAPQDKDGRPDSAVYVKGDRVAVESDGTFEHPAIDEQWAEGYAERNGATLSEVVIEESAESEAEADESDTCTEVMSSGEVCGRDRPCQYHD